MTLKSVKLWVCKDCQPDCKVCHGRNAIRQIEKAKAKELIEFHFWEAQVFGRSQEKLLEGLLKAIEEG